MKEVTTAGLDFARHTFSGPRRRSIWQRRFAEEAPADRGHQLFQSALSLSDRYRGVRATAHHWARVLINLGHEVRLMPASYVKPYVKRQRSVRR